MTNSNEINSKISVNDYLEPFQKIIEEEIKKNIHTLGPKTKLRDSCEYALLNGGKRFRPVLVLMIAKALNHGLDVMPAALAVEYFHTASLIADDLPCMDNDEERRNKPSLHKYFGETTALLSSYALISEGYGLIGKNIELFSKSNFPHAKSDKIALLALQNATYNTGILGATGGQYLDLFPENQSPSFLNEVIEKKTITLFEISFVFGWIFGGGDLEKLEKVKKAAYHFGMAFQIADDIEDVEQDLKNKTQVNVAVNFGKEQAYVLLKEEIKVFLQILDELKLQSQEFRNMAKFLTSDK